MLKQLRSGIILGAFWCMAFNLLLAQPDSVSQAEAEREVWQLSGLVVNKKTLEPIPFAKLGVVHSRRASVCNEEGFFSIPVTRGDTLYFFSLGYKASFLNIDEYLREYQGAPESGYLYSINYLNEDSILMQTVNIFPLNTPTELRTAILENNSSHKDELDYAKDNLDPLVMANLIKTLPADVNDRLVAGRAAYYNQYMNAHIAPTLPILNPMAIIALLKYINDKTKEKKRTKDLNAWEE